MELTKAQVSNLVQALKSYRASKKQFEAAQVHMKTKLDKLKECAQANGNTEELVMPTVHQYLAQAYLDLPEGIE